MAAADREIEEEFRLTREEWDAAKARDRSSRYDNLDVKGRKIAEAQKAYREANREKIAEKRRERRNNEKHPAVR